MTLVHMVLFRVKPEITEEQKAVAMAEMKRMKNLKGVKDHRLIAGGPSIASPIETSKGYQYGLVSFHEDRAAFAEYQSDPDHHEVNVKYFATMVEDFVMFDFEVSPEDEHLCDFGKLVGN